LSKAESIVRQYLDAMERRDLAAAKSFLAPGFYMAFPGGRRFTALEELVDWAKGRYQRALKKYDAFETAGDTVYCFGTLHGELLDGKPYSGVRFDQNVWNDKGEMRLQAGKKWGSAPDFSTARQL